ncbi:MAG: hypothetical protein KGY39_01025 [Anaerolineales bacterium]|nr:hypothetical protein [Anaerolineales bacterium]
MVIAGSDQEVEEWAYEDRKWLRDGDHRFVIIPKEGIPITPTPHLQTTPKAENTFRVWWKLFFDTQP